MAFAVRWCVWVVGWLAVIVERLVSGEVIGCVRG
jgi:hypothetical protein